MTTLLGRWDRRLKRVIDTLSASLLAAVTLIAIVQVIARYGFNSSLIWGEEAIRLLYVWMVLIAAAYAPHMRIGLLADAARGRVRLALTGVRVVVVFGMLGLLVRGAFVLNASFGADQYVTIGISRSWFWYAAIVGCLVWTVATVMASFRRDQPDGLPANTPSEEFNR